MCGPPNLFKIKCLSVKWPQNMGKRKLRASDDPTAASRECLVHTAEATFAFKTHTKVPVVNGTSSPLLL